MSALISWKNAADEASLSLDIGNNNDVGTPLTNLQTRGLGKVWRSTTTSTVTILVDATSVSQVTLLPFDPDADNAINVIKAASNGKLILGGNFASVDSTTAPKLAQVNLDGSIDTAFMANLGAGFDGEVLCVQASFGGWFVGGTFATAAGVASAKYAFVAPDGSVTAGGGANGDVHCANTGRLLLGEATYVGGNFTTIAGESRTRLARFVFGSMIDSGWNPPAINDTVRAIDAQGGGDVVIGGDFTDVGGVTRNRIARISGLVPTLDPSFDPDVDGSVFVIRRLLDGRYLIGGAFSTVGGKTRNNIAMLNPDGSVVDGFDPNASGSVIDIQVLPGNAIAVTGSFNVIGGETRNRMAALDLAGNVLDYLQGSFTYMTLPTVRCALVMPNRLVYFGGRFNAVDGNPRGNVAAMRAGNAKFTRLIGLLGVRPFTGSITISYRPDPMTFVDHLHSWYVDESDDKWNLVAALDTPVDLGGQYLIIFTSTQSIKHGMARLWIGDALELDRGVDAKWRMGFQDSGQLDASAGRQFYEGKGVRTRLLTISLSALDTAKTWGTPDNANQVVQEGLHNLQMDAGTTGEVVVIPRTQTDAWIQNTAVYGHIANPWEIEHQAGPNWYASFAVEEER